MDERHWWIATRVNDSLKDATKVNVSDLEGVFLETNNHNCINAFLEEDGPIYIYFTKNKRADVKSIYVSSEIKDICDRNQFNIEHLKMILILKKENMTISINNFENELFCIEMKNSIIHNMSTLFSQGLVPMLMIQYESLKQPDKLQSLSSQLTNIWQNVQNCTEQLYNYTTEEEPIKSFLDVNLDYSDPLKQYESFVTNVMSEIEYILSEVNDRSSEGDIFLSSEMEKWQRRFHLTQSLVNQLKGKMFKNSVGYLVSKKSKMIKKWRQLEISITEALNSSRDKMKYLEAFKPEFSIIERYPMSPIYFLITVPRIFKKMKKMESASRFFAKSGHLGSFICMLRRQLLTSIDSKIQTMTGYGQSPEKLLVILNTELSNPRIQTFLEMSLAQIKALIPKEDIGGNIDGFSSVLTSGGVVVDSFLGTMKLSNILYDIFVENLSNLKDGLNMNASVKYSTTTMLASLESVNSSSSKLETESDFISIFDDNKLFANWIEINNSVRKFIDICFILTRLKNMVYTKIANVSVQKCDIVQLVEETEASPSGTRYNKSNKYDGKSTDRDSGESSDEASGTTRTTGMFTLISSLDQLKYLLKIDLENDMEVNIKDLIQSTSTLVYDNIKSKFDLLTLLNLNRTGTFETGKIDETFAKHEEIMDFFDKTFSVFLNLIFLRPMRTEEVLSILSKFECIKFRKSIKCTIFDKVCEVFLNFNKDITDAYESYKTFKNEPVIINGTPPIASTVAWIQKVLASLELPMIRFQDMKEITQMKEYESIVRQYNRVTKQLVTFQSAYISHWLMLVDTCVAKLKTPLLVMNYSSYEVEVNTPDNIVTVINETKYMIRLQKQLSTGGMELLRSERRIKLFYSKLSDSVNYFEDVRKMIPTDMMFMFINFIKAVLQSFQVGCSSLTWSTVNIDVFLHKTISSVNNLKSVIEGILKLDGQLKESLKRIETNKFYNYQVFLDESWLPDLFVQESARQLTDTKLGCLTIIEQCIELQNEMRKIIFPEEKRTSSTWLFESEHNIFSNIKERYNNILLQAMSRSIANNLLFVARCTNCAREAIDLFIADSGYNPLLIICDDDDRVRHLESHRFCKNDMRFLAADAEALDDDGFKLIRFVMAVKYEIPMIKYDPELEVIQLIIGQVSDNIINVYEDVVNFSGHKMNRNAISNIEQIQELIMAIIDNFNGYEARLQDTLTDLYKFDFLWKMSGEHLNIEESLLESDKCSHLKERIQQVLDLKSRLQHFPKEIEIDCLIISTNIFKDVLFSLLNTWQNSHGQQLHEEAKRLLDDVTHYREGVTQDLKQDIDELEQLNDLLSLLDQIFDQDLNIDSVYQPIELMYMDLVNYDMPILRSEATELENLRQYWSDLMKMAEDQRNRLLHEKKNVFHQELDKQMKKFTVEVIQFRNQFDYECPSMAGSDPIEVEKKLEQFQKQYSIYEDKRNTLVSISKLFGLTINDFHELESMKEDLMLLTQLYSLYQKFSKFEKSFNNTLWSVVDLDDVFNKLTDFWDECLALPSKIKEKESYTELKSKIDYLIKLHGILIYLAAKEIRNRHWLQVMQVTGANFQLESGTFKCSDLTEINLLEHRTEIEQICSDAKKEMQLEIKLNQIEEEWTEQVLVFQKHVRRGPVILEVKFTHSLLLQLEDSQILLMNMFNSRHIEPMKEEAALWAAKLMEISEVLDLWLEVQQLWLDLEDVFVNPVIIKEFSQESKRFERFDKSYIKLMKRAYETKNVLQCCISNESSKKGTLKNIQQEMESSFESLKTYLKLKRHTFSRLWFVPDGTILSILNCSNNHKQLECYLTSLFSSITELEIVNEPKGDLNQITTVRSAGKEELTLNEKVTIKDDIVVTLNALKHEVSDSLSVLASEGISYVTSGDNLEEMARKFPTQICNSSLHLYWTNEIFSALNELKVEKKSLIYLAKKFNTQVSKIPIVLNRNSWKSGEDQTVTGVQRIRLRSMTLAALYLRDSLVNLSGKKIKDSDDFEWHKIIKMSIMKSASGDIQRFQLNVMTSTHEMGTEFQGNVPTIAYTPVTERCLLTLMTCLEHRQIASLCGPSQFGKSAIIGDLSRMTNRYHNVMICQQSMSQGYLRNFIFGVAANGCLGLLDNVEQLKEHNLSLIMVLISQIGDALKLKSETLSVADEQISLRNGFDICLTSCLSVTNLESKIPSNIRTAFRIVCVTEPDLFQILKWYCTYYNFRVARILALRLYTLMRQSASLIGKDGKQVVHVRSIVGALKKTSQLKKLLIQKEKSTASESNPNAEASKVSGTSFIEFWPTFIERKIKSPTSSMIKQKTMDVPASLSPAAKNEHHLIIEALLETILPSIHPEHEKTFKDLLRDTFPGYADIQPKTSKDSIPHELLLAIGRECKSQKIVVSNNFIEKFVQLYHVAKCHQSVILCGPTFSGKSTTMSILLSAMNHVCDNQVAMAEAPSKSHKQNSPPLKDYSDSQLLNMNHHLYSLFPSIFENEAEMFGNWSTNKDNLNDGLLTYLWRRANRNDLVSWIAFDGAIKAEWSMNLHPILDIGHRLHLPNGHCLPQIKDIKFVFEMDSFNDASPGIIARSGIVYFSGNTLTWRDIRNMWFDNKRSLEVIALNKIFDKIMDPMTAYVVQYHKDYSSNTVLIAFQHSLKLLSQMLMENKEIGGEMHIQRLFTFCFIWSLDSQISELNKPAITALLKKETLVLPDDENSICIFDYYVDESGEWDLWASKVVEDIDTTSLYTSGEMVVDNVTTLRCKHFLAIVTRAALNFAIVGPRGVGKSLILDNNWKRIDRSEANIVRLVYSRFTKSSQLKMFLEANIEHRHGLMYGGKDNKHLIVVIEDLNLARDQHQDNGSIVKPNEILRQLLNSNKIQNVKYPYEQIKISDFNVVVSIATDDGHLGLKSIDSRLLRHFVPIKLEQPQPAEVSGIVRGIFEYHVNGSENSNITIDQTNCLITSTQKLYQQVASILKRSQTDGRRHITFTLRHINEMALSLRSYQQQGDNLELTLLQYWTFLVKRTFQDSLVLEIDIRWFESVVQTIVKDVWNVDILADNVTLDRIFSTLPSETEVSGNKDSTNSKANTTIISSPAAVAIDDLSLTSNFVLSKISQHNGDLGRPLVDMVISDNVILQIMNIHRLITKPYNGHVVLVGSLGSHLSQLCRIASHIANIPIFPLDTSSDATFIDSMKSVLRMVGSEGKKAAILLTARDLRSDFILDNLNSLMISGDCPLLFPADELAGLLSAISISLKKDKSTTQPSSNYNLMEQFRCRIRTNLHVMLCLRKNHQVVSDSLTMYPGLMTYSSVVILRDCADDYLTTDAGYFVENCLDEINLYLTDGKDRDNLIRFIVSVHQEALKYSDLSTSAVTKTVKIGKIVNNDKKKEIYKYDNVPSAPYSQVFLRDAIRSITDGNFKRLYNGPFTFHRFLIILQKLLKQKTVEKVQSMHTLTRALNSLQQTKHDIGTMTDLISREREKFNSISEKSKQLLRELIDKVTKLRMITAKKGDNSYLNDMLSKSNITMFTKVETDPLLADEERDDLDVEFERVREENLIKRQSALKDTLAKTKKEYQNLKKDLAYAIEQVTYWKSKIDRQVIDRIKSFQNPPKLVVDVIEMVFVLIGKHIQRSRKDSEFEDNDSDEEKSEVKARWKHMQQYMSDPAKFVDIIHNVSWTDGLSSDVYGGVKSYLSTGKEGQTGVTGEGTLISQAENVNIKAKKQKVDLLTSTDATPVPTKAISVAATKYASEDAALLVQYAVALVEYTEKCGPVRLSLQNIRELEIELKESQSVTKKANDDVTSTSYDYDSLNLSDEEIDALKAECLQLENDYNNLIGQRSIVETELKALSDRLEMSQWLVSNIKPMESKWEQLSVKYQNDRLIFIQCLISSAYLAYGAPHCFEHRSQFLGNCIQQAKKTGLVNEQFTFSRLQITEFLHSGIELQKLELFCLPTCEDELDNATFMLNDCLLRNWLLLSDNSRRVISWLSRCLVKYDVNIIPYSEVHNRLEGCLASGSTLIVTDCDMDLLINDDVLRQILRHQRKFFKEQKPFKLLLGNDHELECNPSFRLYLHTCSTPDEIPDIIVSSTFLVSFNMSMPILINEFSDRFIQKAKPSIDAERMIILRDKGKMKKRLFKIEEQILDDLSNGIRNVNNVSTCARIIRYLKFYEEIDVNLQQKELNYSSNKKSIENYHQIAMRFSTCFQMASKIHKIQTDYSLDFYKYVSLFDSLVESSDRLSNKTIIEKITKKTTQFALLSMNDENKFVYCLLLSIEIHKALNHLDANNEEFFLSPITVAQRLNPDIIKTSETKSSNTKKPFDWITDEQINSVKILSVCFPCFKDILESMYKDSKEHQWKILFEGESPETVNFLDKLFKSQLNPFQRLCFLRTVRPDRIMQATYLFTQQTLNLRLKGGISTSDMKLALNATKSRSVILLKYNYDSMEASIVLQQLKTKYQAHLIEISINDQSKNGLKGFHRQLSSRISRVYDALSAESSVSSSVQAPSLFVVLHLSSCEHILAIQSRVNSCLDQITSATTELSVSKSRDRNNVFFSVFFTVSNQSLLDTNVNISQLKNMTIVFLDSPNNVRDFLFYMFNAGWTALEKRSTDLLTILHNCCLLMAIVRARCSFNGMKFQNSEIVRTISNPATMYSLVEKFQIWFDKNHLNFWNVLRFFISEIIYGSRISNDYDRSSITAMTEFWITSNSVKKEFEFPKLKYHCPPILYTSSPKLTDVKRAFSNVPTFLFECAEACHLATTPLTKINPERAIMAKVDKMNSDPSSSITLKIDVAKIENELFEISKNLVAKLPRSTVDSLQERLKKNNNNANYVNVMMEEIRSYHLVFGEITIFVQKLRKVINNELGDRLSIDDVQIIMSLLQNEVPERWHNKLIVKQCPLTLTTIEWLSALLTKYQQIEKLILTVKEKVVYYNLSSFQKPESLMSLFNQDVLSQFMKTDKSGSYREVRYNIEFTNREKDHLRDPPADGIFVSGLYLWGCGIDKSTFELIDPGPKVAYTTLPVVHMTFSSSEQEKVDNSDQYICPIFVSSTSKEVPILSVTFYKEGVSPTKWMLRGVFITTNPF